MILGKSSIHGTVLSFLFVGLSWEHLWFSPDGVAQKEEKVIMSDEVKLAHKCPSCGTLVIEKSKIE